MRLDGVVDDFLGEASELFLRREDAEPMVDDWDGDEPDDAGPPRIEVVDLIVWPN